MSVNRGALTESEAREFVSRQVGKNLRKRMKTLLVWFGAANVLAIGGIFLAVMNTAQTTAKQVAKDNVKATINSFGLEKRLSDYENAIEKIAGEASTGIQDAQNEFRTGLASQANFFEETLEAHLNSGKMLISQRLEIFHMRLTAEIDLIKREGSRALKGVERAENHAADISNQLSNIERQFAGLNAKKLKLEENLRDATASIEALVSEKDGTNDRLLELKLVLEELQDHELDKAKVVIDLIENNTAVDGLLGNVARLQRQLKLLQSKQLELSGQWDKVRIVDCPSTKLGITFIRSETSGMTRDEYECEFHAPHDGLLYLSLQGGIQALPSKSENSPYCAYGIYVDGKRIDTTARNNPSFTASRQWVPAFMANTHAVKKGKHTISLRVSGSAICRIQDSDINGIFFPATPSA